MAPIEQKPLPPPNANVTTITEGDRVEFLARANEVLVRGKPMSFYPVQPPIWSFPESFAANKDADDWLMRLLQGSRSR